MAADRIAIQNALRMLVMNGEFLAVRYDSGVAQATTERVAPSSCVCNETAMSVEADTRFGRGLRRLPSSWTFDVITEFSREVILDKFIQQVNDNLPRAGGLIFGLTDCDFAHPPQQSPQNGTKATFTFVAINPR